MSNYVKYIAADGTVHLCHEDSPMLMHANWYKLGAVGLGINAAKKAIEWQKEAKKVRNKAGSMISGIFNKTRDQISDPDFVKDQISALIAEQLNFKSPVEGYSFHNKGNAIQVNKHKANEKFVSKAIPLSTFLTIMNINAQKIIDDIEENGDASVIQRTVKDAVAANKIKLIKTLDSMLKYDNSTYDFRERVEKKRR